MATKAALESANVALKAQLAQMQAELDALSAQPAPKKEKPLVTRGYFKRLDERTGKWIDDTSRPCIVVNVPGSKPRKMTRETFEASYITHYEDIVLAYEKLS